MLRSPLLGAFCTFVFRLGPCQDGLLRGKKRIDTWFFYEQTYNIIKDQNNDLSICNIKDWLHNLCNHITNTHPPSACLLWGTWWNGMPGKPFCVFWWSHTHSMLDNCIQCYLYGIIENVNLYLKIQFLKYILLFCKRNLPRAYTRQAKLPIKFPYMYTCSVITAKHSWFFLTDQ